ncbi:aldolase [Prauserella sp. PE36]|uniref:class II aldolase/adducin family protein n=1 Tax=Prauserella sp. PE36 TaxID=1504709 RepID=UPI000DE2732C|nr:class II aldolase/adducin family protein [Prauserella sp. PE36]RBM21653.1 aldolase [Prauserella sp. PE36]
MGELSSLRELVADACRVLAGRGLADGILGHVSLRVDSDRILVRCRGPREKGLGYTTANDIRVLDFDGQAGAAGELDGGYQAPNELPLHTEVLRTRRDVDAVVHAHPPEVVACDLAGIPIRPIVGAFDIPGCRLAADGVPVYPRGVLVRTKALAVEMTAAMGDHPVVLLRGHGLTSATPSVEQAVLQAVSVDHLARMSTRVVAAGGVLEDLSPEDMAELPDLGATFNTAMAWRHEIARLDGVVASRVIVGS